MWTVREGTDKSLVVECVCVCVCVCGYLMTVSTGVAVSLPAIQGLKLCTASIYGVLSCITVYTKLCAPAEYNGFV